MRKLLPKIARLLEARKILQRLAELVDLRDAFTFGGLALVGYGLHAIYPPAAFIVVGAALFWIGVS